MILRKDLRHLNNLVSYRFSLFNLPVSQHPKYNYKRSPIKSSNFSSTSIIFSEKHLQPTIYALATAPGKAGVGVIRISGPNASQVVKYMTAPSEKNSTALHVSNLDFKSSLPQGKLTLRKIFHPLSRELLDLGLITMFKAPNSFTGEDIVELHVHSSSAILRGILEALQQLNSVFSTGISSRASLPKFRLALPGEFTRRAFENNKLDLTSVEGLADLLNSETSAQRRLALRHTQGEVGQLYKEWRELLISSRGQIEAIIDFGDDEEIEPDSLLRARAQVEKIRNAVARHLGDQRRGEILMSGIKVALIGSPNAGKSSLLNCLTRHDTAIVSPIPGTTRDIITGKLDLGGMPLVILDTAGIRNHSDDIIEQEGIRRALKAGQDAEICLLVLDGKQLLLDEKQSGDLFLSVPDFFSLISSISSNKKVPWVVINKCDSISDDKIGYIVSSVSKLIHSQTNPEISTLFITPISCLTGWGMDSFNMKLVNFLRDRFESPDSEPASITHSRHRQHLEETCIQLINFLELTSSASGTDLVLAAEHLRIAATSLGHITGQVDVEEVLDSLFREFCIGK